MSAQNACRRPGDADPDGHVGSDRVGGVRSPAVAGALAAVLAASCCILPILLIGVGVAGAGLMATTMAYEWITLPAGVIGLAVAYALYFRERKRCEARACRLAGRRINQALLAAATAGVVAALLLRLFPSWTASLVRSLARL